MAKTPQQLLQDELGALHFQLVMQAAEIGQLREENAALKVAQEDTKIVREPDKQPALRVLPGKEVR